MSADEEPTLDPFERLLFKMIRDAYDQAWDRARAELIDGAGTGEPKGLRA